MQTELMHYNILGAKWGQRRFQNYDGTLTAAGKERYRKAASPKKNTAKKSSSTKAVQRETLVPKKSVKEMTDKEINDFLNRRSLEQRYLSAIAEDTKKAGETKVDKIVKDFSDKLTSKLVDSAATYANKKITDAVFGKDWNKNGTDKKKSD